MTRNKAYKTELDPTCKQVKQLLQHAGCARWAFNWGLQKKIEAYKANGKSPSAIDLHRELTALKKVPVDQGGIPWMYESSKWAPQEALRNLDTAFKNFFRRCKSGDAKKGFPKFKSRKNGVGGFRLYGAIRVELGHVTLPFLGRLKLKERGYLPIGGVRILSASISEKAGRWFVSLRVEEEVSGPTAKPHHIVGVDLGIKSLAVTSDGVVYENPKALADALRLLRIRQKAVSRKQKGSKSRKKAVEKVAELHQRVANIRKDAIHKMTAAITKSATVVVVEDLNVAGMVKNRKLARSLSDVSFGEVRRQLEYKSEWGGLKLVVADRFYPSSKRCSSCGNVRKQLSLSEREYRCESPDCGEVLDRDLNAALNLKNLVTV